MAGADTDDPVGRHPETAPAVSVPLPNVRPPWLIPPGAAGAYGRTEVIGEPDSPTPLGEQDDSLGPVPTGALWAMRYLRHHQFGRPRDLDDPDRIRWASRDGSDIFALDDGGDHCMVCRPLGDGPDGSTAYLVARVTRLDFEDVRAGWTVPARLFDHAKEFTLCAVFEGSVANVATVARYRRLGDVPPGYLSPPASDGAVDPP